MFVNKYLPHCLFWTRLGSIVKIQKFWINEMYACATHREAKASGRFTFTWPCCEISFQDEILARHQVPGLTLSLVWLPPIWHCLVVSCKQIQSEQGEAGWTRAASKVALVSCKHPLTFNEFVVWFCFLCCILGRESRRAKARGKEGESNDWQITNLRWRRTFPRKFIIC